MINNQDFHGYRTAWDAIDAFLATYDIKDVEVYRSGEGPNFELVDERFDEDETVLELTCWVVVPSDGQDGQETYHRISWEGAWPEKK